MAVEERKRIPDPGFGGDRGEADPALAAALAAYAAQPEPHGPRGWAVLAALASARLLVPVLAAPSEAAEPGESATPPPDALAAEKSTDMAVPTIRTPDGRWELPVFTSVSALARWRADARPVPVPAGRAALAALAEGAQALLLDPAGPVRHLVAGVGLRALAEGRVPCPPESDPAVLETARAVAAAVPGVVGARVRPGEAASESDLTVLVEVDGPPEAIARAVAERLAADDLLRSRLVRGLALAVLPAGSPAARPAEGGGDTRLTV